MAKRRERMPEVGSSWAEGPMDFGSTTARKRLGHDEVAECRSSGSTRFDSVGTTKTVTENPWWAIRCLESSRRGIKWPRPGLIRTSIWDLDGLSMVCFEEN